MKNISFLKCESQNLIASYHHKWEQSNDCKKHCRVKRQ